MERGKRDEVSTSADAKLRADRQHRQHGQMSLEMHLCDRQHDTFHADRSCITYVMLCITYVMLPMTQAYDLSHGQHRN
jgi:hypothetical protein